jgi:hypothetical protein
MFDERAVAAADIEHARAWRDHLGNELQIYAHAGSRREVVGRSSFLKKEPKNFYESAPSLSGKAAAKTIKSCLLLFFKKEVLAFLPSLAPALAQPSVLGAP